MYGTVQSGLVRLCAAGQASVSQGNEVFGIVRKGEVLCCIVWFGQVNMTNGVI